VDIRHGKKFDNRRFETDKVNHIFMFFNEVYYEIKSVDLWRIV